MLHYDHSIRRMRQPDLEKERSERVLSINDFLSEYNEDLPESFPRVSLIQLEDFKEVYPSLFKNKKEWTLGQHRKKVMDWLSQQVAVRED